MAATITDAFGTPEARTAQKLFDELNRIEKVIDPNLDETLIGYDADGNLISVTDDNLNVTSYEFDPLNRRIRTVDPLLADETFVYDGNGNVESYTDRKLQTFNFELLSKVVYGFVMRRRDPGVLHSRI